MRWIFILMLPLVFSLSVMYYPIKNKVKVGDYAIYKMILQNDEEIPLNIKVYGLGLNKIELSLEPGEKREIELRIECRAGILYNNPVTLEYNGKKEVIFLKIYGYPSRTESIPMCFLNYEQVDKDSLVIRVSCNKKINKTLLYLNGLEIEGKDKFYISGLRPGEYLFFMRIFFEDGSYIERELPAKVFEVVRIEKRVEKGIGIFLNTYKITIKNEGNDVYYGGMILDSLGWLISGGKSKDGKVYITFLVNPGEEKVYKIYFLNKNVIFYFIPLIVILIAWILFKPISVEKEYIYYSKDGKTTVHVFIRIKGFPLGGEKIKIIDYVPSYAKITNFETIKPEIKDNILVWEIPKVNRGEEILLNYNLIFDFEISEGELKLPSCHVMVGNRRFEVNARKMRD